MRATKRICLRTVPAELQVLGCALQNLLIFDSKSGGQHQSPHIVQQAGGEGIIHHSRADDRSTRAMALAKLAVVMLWSHKKLKFREWMASEIGKHLHAENQRFQILDSDQAERLLRVRNLAGQSKKCRVHQLQHFGAHVHVAGRSGRRFLRSEPSEERKASVTAT